MQIYLLRHGIADDASPGVPDAERALTAEGRDRLKRVLRRAEQAGVKPSLILSSPYKRALQTAELAADVLAYEGKIVKTGTLVPNSSPFDTWSELRAYTDEPAILLASHEPLMSSMAAFLLSSPGLMVDMKKGALVRIDLERTGRDPHGVLKWMLTPATV